MPCEDLQKSTIVQLILDKKTEEALNTLAKHYRLSAPKIRIGLPKGHKNKILGCYSPKTQTIALVNSDVLGNPFVILHEFYHHTRTAIDKRHKGTERNADKFANEFIREYKATLNR